MGNVVKLQPRLAGKTALMIAQALEAELAGTAQQPQIIVAANTNHKVQIRRQLQCMAGLRSTRIEVLTTVELAARAQRQKEKGNGV